MKADREIIRGFVVFEGIDGSGTTTQLARLKQNLEKAGTSFSASFEPTDGPVGRLIRSALSGEFPMVPETVARLFAADRGEHLHGAGGIAERAAGGALVVSDRYLFSSLAYQGLTCGLELPSDLNSSFPLPELLVFFRLPVADAVGRFASRETLDIYENRAFQERVAAAYDQVITSFEGTGMRIATIDAGKSPDAVEKEVWAAIQPLVSRSRV
jgi:dTMP kinase